MTILRGGVLARQRILGLTLELGSLRGDLAAGGLDSDITNVRGTIHVSAFL